MNEEWLQKSLRKASILYNFQIDRLEKLGGGYENKLYGHNDSTIRIVVRVTPPGHKTESEVRAEMDWLQFLAENGAPVERVVRSKRGELVEIIDTDDGKIPVVCFEWASGQLVKRDDFSPELFQIWGKAVGMMHRLTKHYEPTIVSDGKIQWYDDVYLDRLLIPTHQQKVLDRFDRLIKHFKNLPRTRDSFGLIHQDVHHANLFLDGDRITVLDFDDSVYGFFIFDIANALGFSIWEKQYDMSNEQFAEFFLNFFMKGYEQQNHLDEFWMDQLEPALKLFEFIHYNAFNMDNDLADTGSFDSLDERTKTILRRYRRSIEESLPYIENTFCPYR